MPWIEAPAHEKPMVPFCSDRSSFHLLKTPGAPAPQRASCFPKKIAVLCEGSSKSPGFWNLYIYIIFKVQSVLAKKPRFLVWYHLGGFPIFGHRNFWSDHSHSSIIFLINKQPVSCSFLQWNHSGGRSCSWFYQAQDFAWSKSQVVKFNGLVERENLKRKPSIFVWNTLW